MFVTAGDGAHFNFVDDNSLRAQNLDLLSGIIEGIGEDLLSARLAPEPGYCCVRMKAS